MLLVRAKAAASQIHGVGLIAQEFIPAGTIVWKFKPGFDVEIKEKDLDKLSLTAREQVLYYACLNEATRTFVLSSDDDRVTNHSDNPNTRCRDDYTFAVRDIQEGEEITSDYAELVVFNFQSHKSQG
jgi:SET domain-containing protein